MIKLKLKEKRFDDNLILENINLEIKSGDILHIIGKSGVGKTTLIRIVAGLDSHFTGQLSNTFQKAAIVFPERVFLGGINIFKEIKLFTNRSDSELLDAFFELGLDKDINKKASELSTGMRSRLSIIRAFLSDSDVLFLDEPLLGLDDYTKNITINFISKHLKGRTVLYTGESIAPFLEHEKELFI